LASVNRRQVALDLAEELLTDFELTQLAPMELVRKASRLARLLDDQEAVQWLSFEVAGYPRGEKGLSRDSWAAAGRSGRQYFDKEDKEGKSIGGKMVAYTQTAGELYASIEALKLQLTASTDAPVNITSANPRQFVSAQSGNGYERGLVRALIADSQGRLDKILGSIHLYVSQRNYELRFGAAVETAFEQVRQTVDGQIAALVPDAVSKLAAAFENAASDQPEHWANAASTCRRLIKAVADELRPAGPDVAGRKMGNDQYINRLIDWIVTIDLSPTAAAVTTTELAHLGERLDAADGAGHKGAHSDVTRYDASRFLTGTYLLLGDILNLKKVITGPPAIDIGEVDDGDVESDGAATA
jgi:hypothetical protein